MMLKRFFILLSIVPALGAGCARYDRAVQKVESAFTTGSLDAEYRKATQSFEDGEFGLAAAQFENLIPRMPEGPRREELVYKQGVAYLQTKNYHDARENFLEYQARYPEGLYQSLASHNLVRVTTEVADRKRVAEDRLKAAEKDLAELKTLESLFPNDPRIKYAMGNLYYETGDYELAGQKYFDAQALEAAYREKDNIENRLFVDAQGRPAALSPAARRSAEADEDPIEIVDLYPYASRNNTDAFAARLVYSIATGKVWNRGKETLHNVQIEVRFENALNAILDFQTITIGTLKPGEVRPFLARASNYDNLNNITGVEIMKRFDRGK